MTIPGLIAAIFTMLAGGLGVTLLALRGETRINLAEACALSWLLGTGLISLLLWGIGLVLSGPLLQAAVTVFAIAIGVTGLIRARRALVRFAVPRPRSLIEWILVGSIAIQFGIMLYVSLANGLGWDGLLNWEIKARYAFLNDGVMPAAYFGDTSRNFTHQAYPPWIPFTELWLYLWMGQTHQFWLKILFPTFYAAGTILLVTLSCRLSASRWIGLLTGALLFFVPCLTNFPGGVQVGYVDVPISMLYLAAIGYLLLATQKSDPCWWRISALCVALLPWAKTEGIILWLIAAFCCTVANWRARGPWIRLLWLIPGPLIALSWKIFYSAMGKVGAFEYLPLTLSTLITNSPRAPLIAKSVVAEMTEFTHWSVFWPVVIVAFISLFWRLRDRRLLILFLAAAAPIAIYAFLYLFSGWPDWTRHMDQSLSRLLLHVMPVLWLVIALALRPPTVPVGQFSSSVPSDL